MNPPSLKLATRGSKLALWQANYVAKLLQNLGSSVELVVLKTTGDAVQDRFLHEIGGKGLFIKELEESLLKKTSDLAMHSLKDLPVNTPADFALPAVLKRHSVYDVIVFKKEIYSRLNIPRGSVLNANHMKALGPMKIATSSLRRKCLLEQLDSGIEITNVRGNVDTRLKKLEQEDWQGLILAEASLDRLKITDHPYHKLDSNWFIPCAGQGALVIETLSQSPCNDFLKQLNCRDTSLCVLIERSILKALGGDCTMPFGCLVTEDQRDPQKLVAHAIVLDMSGGSASTVQSMSKERVGNGIPLVEAVLAGLEKNRVSNILKNINISYTQRFT
jgi:hydroxymethylbilane synthase